MRGWHATESGDLALNQINSYTDSVRQTDLYEPSTGDETMIKYLLAAMLVAGATGADAAMETDGAEAPPRNQPDQSLKQLRDTLRRFEDVNVALSEGYAPVGMCETAEMMGRDPAEGAMGVHFVRIDLLQPTAFGPRVDGVGTNTDFSTPTVLLYEPQADGGWELLGAENLVFADAWDAKNRGMKPMYRGRAYDYMRDDPATEVDEAHGFAPHYDLHIWLFRENPLGTYRQFNPDVTCDDWAPNAG